jgi:hypothetical protein
MVCEPSVLTPAPPDGGGYSPMTARNLVARPRDRKRRRSRPWSRPASAYDLDAGSLRPADSRRRGFHLSIAIERWNYKGSRCGFVPFRRCPAAVCGNDLRQQHWATGKRRTVGGQSCPGPRARRPASTGERSPPDRELPRGSAGIRRHRAAASVRVRRGGSGSPEGAKVGRVCRRQRGSFVPPFL